MKDRPAPAAWSVKKKIKKFTIYVRLNFNFFVELILLIITQRVELQILFLFSYAHWEKKYLSILDPTTLEKKKKKYISIQLCVTILVLRLLQRNSKLKIHNFGYDYECFVMVNVVRWRDAFG